MSEFAYLTPPKITPPLDPEFRPAILANLAFREAVRTTGSSQKLVIGLERSNNAFSRYETEIFPEDHPQFEQSLFYIERIVKFLLWQRGGKTLYVGGSEKVGRYLQQVYSANGEREFDFSFMSRIYDQPLKVVPCSSEEVPQEKEPQKSLGRNLNGNRIGFDLGASDLKVSAVVNGEAIFSTEIEWQPVEQTDPNYHRQKIRSALELAASKLPQVDAIGGSSAGVYINNRPMIASLYRGIPKEKFDQINNLFLDIRNDWEIPLEIVNDGEVTALAGSMSLGENSILGVAMGSSEAVGYITPSGKITDWLNELAFAPVDYQTSGPVDEWSGDQGIGALYFSQQCVFRLAPKLSIDIPADLTNAQKLKFVQDRLEADNENTHQIWESMGVYLGYAIAHYADFYEIEFVLILGRCTSGKGGTIILEFAKRVLEEEFPVLAETIKIQLPEEKSRRVGQSIAAASLPKAGRG
jgi:predicted NBD/HSP70 family sugar kinase